MPEHLLEGGFVFLDILVLNSEISARVILTGRGRVVSGILAENQYVVCHESLLGVGCQKQPAEIASQPRICQTPMCLQVDICRNILDL